MRIFASQRIDRIRVLALCILLFLSLVASTSLNLRFFSASLGSLFGLFLLIGGLHGAVAHRLMGVRTRQVLLQWVITWAIAWCILYLPLFFAYEVLREAITPGECPPGFSRTHVGWPADHNGNGYFCSENAQPRDDVIIFNSIDDIYAEIMCPEGYQPSAVRKRIIDVNKNGYSCVLTPEEVSIDDMEVDDIGSVGKGLRSYQVYQPARSYLPTAISSR